jgi:hypothetical protein
MKNHVRTTDFDLVHFPASVTQEASQPSHTGRFQENGTLGTVTESHLLEIIQG